MPEVNLTTRAREGGWELPELWSVQADISDDYDNAPTDFDCYTQAQIDAWTRGEWSFVVVSVWVEDDNGREWGRSVLGGVEYGWLPWTDEDNVVTGGAYADPLDDAPGQHNVIREHDMIGEALRKTVAALEAFGTPVLREPVGVTVTGL